MNKRARRALLTLFLAQTALVGFVATVPAAGQEVGKVEFNNHCRTCHSMKEDDNRLGPSLHNIFGANAAAASGYASYSQGLKSSGITWDERTLDEFIANPDAVIPSNNMKPYKGITDKTLRTKIVTYLKAHGS